MKSACITIILSLLIVPSLHARALEPEKRELIDQMLEFSEVGSVVNYMASALTIQMFEALKKKHDNIDQAVAGIIYAEAQTIMREEYVLNNRLNEIFYSLYDEAFSTKELEEMVAFFSTDIGRKTLLTLPIISQKSQEQAKLHARAIGPNIQQRIMNKLKEVSEAIANEK